MLRPRRLSTVAVLAAVLAIPAATSIGTVPAVAAPTSTVFVNELHYDNAGTDAGEAIEIAGPAGTDLTGWSIVRYNGSGGASYGTSALSGTLADLGGGYGTTVVTFPENGIQNGAPDGLALVTPANTVEQFLSYEGTFAATNGPANGLTSTDIGVAQAGTEPVGASLGLTGTGTTYGDFTWTATDQNSFGTINAAQTFTGGGPAVPVATCPATLVTPLGTAASAGVSATDADSDIATIVITSAPVPGITVTPAVDGAATLEVAATTAAGDYDVVIEFATDDVPEQTTTCTIEVTVDAPAERVLISEVQGDAAASPLDGDDVIVEAIVTSMFTNQDAPDGFFVQEEGLDSDGDAGTSEGLYVFCRGSCPAAVAPGDLVRVTGTVGEFFGMTQISARTFEGGLIETLSTGNPLPAATPVELPASGSTRAEATFETVEGMVVTFADTLVLSEYFELARYGQVVLTVDEQPYQFTHDNAPDVAAYQAFLADLATRRIILDDDNNDQNDAVTGTVDEPYPYPVGGLAVDNRFRGGDTVSDLTGVMHWSFAGQGGTDAWRIRPIAEAPPVFEQVNPAPAEPEDVGGDLQVATFNVLNYFATIDTTSSGSSGPCGPSGTLDCRGADSPAELERQRAKIVAALVEMDADIVGLIEIQNDADVSTLELVAALNAATSPGRYAAVSTGTIGTDAIKVALIYQPGAVTPAGDYAVLDSTVDPRFIDTRNRPVLIQTFEEVGTGERITVAVNHFKSKGSPCTPDDPDLGDGQANCAGTRTQAAEALADYLATDPTNSGDPDFLILGDLNAYRRETAITTLIDAGYTDLIEQFVGDDAYSFLFDGQLGYLDHALATPDLVRQVTGVTEWAINADEVPLFDYNDDVRDVGESAFERESSALPLYEPDPLRSSDHNPLLVGLDLGDAPVLTIDDAVIVGRRGGGGTALFDGAVSGAFSACPTLELAIEGVAILDVTTSRIGRTTLCVSLTSRGLVGFDYSTGDVSGAVVLPRSFNLTDDIVTFALTVDDTEYVTDRSGRRRGLVWTAD